MRFLQGVSLAVRQSMRPSATSLPRQTHSHLITKAPCPCRLGMPGAQDAHATRSSFASRRGRGAARAPAARASGLPSNIGRARCGPKRSAIRLYAWSSAGPRPDRCASEATRSPKPSSSSRQTVCVEAGSRREPVRLEPFKQSGQPRRTNGSTAAGRDQIAAQRSGCASTAVSPSASARSASSQTRCNGSSTKPSHQLPGNSIRMQPESPSA